MNVLLVEDNLVDIEYFELLASKIPLITHIEVCKTISEVTKSLHKTRFDIIFWDMVLNDYNGIDILKTFEELPPVIAITSQIMYSISAFEFGFIDYIVKPYTFERLMSSINRVIQNNKLLKQNQEEFVFLKIGRGLQKIHFNNIVFGEAYGAFTKIHLTTSEIVLVSESITLVLGQLPLNIFKRIHKSYFINYSKLVSINTQGIKLESAAYELPLSKTYRDEFDDILKKL